MHACMCHAAYVRGGFANPDILTRFETGKMHCNIHRVPWLQIGVGGWDRLLAISLCNCTVETGTCKELANQFGC